MTYSEDEHIERARSDLEHTGRYWAIGLSSSHFRSLKKRLESEYPRIQGHEYHGDNGDHYQCVLVDLDFADFDIEEFARIARRRQVLMTRGQTKGLPE
ncbi:hypothetical protein QA648_36965 (plasmid) [Rhizobium sp. CB3171]|uniref:hypothetical protein n=1 Tax=Rhizobium sp. CB3171 TaxID=3039157 RepID=UPI0024B051EE|nr:hypothetical protein [Rhizobium sp. CB3171]WFU07531.1 hypothetical protein QA648_36965 [Rhizobium sp. CB3171]